MAKRRRSRIKSLRHLPPVELTIESLAHDGRGVARLEGKAVFIHGALVGERVLAQLDRKYKDYDEAEVVEVLTASADRVEPKCPHFGRCGGCSLQHLSPEAQILNKQQILVDNLGRIGKVEPAQWLAPMTGPAWGYRRKARLAVKDVPAKGRVLVGFRERGQPFVMDMQQCPILHSQVDQLLMPLSELIGGLSISARLPQIEVAVGELAAEAAQQRAKADELVLVFRVLEPPTPDDLMALAKFAEQHDLRVVLQPAGPDSLYPLQENQAKHLSYALPAHELTLDFLPNDFTQVNRDINRQMIDRAIELLDLQPDHKVLDLFCGLGNFTLPLAKQAAHVVGVEGDDALVARAQANARSNGLTNTDFFKADLYTELSDAPWLHASYDRILLDPPRSGAREILPHLATMAPAKMVYVSCNPSTLARDAGELVRDHGFRLVSAGVMDMFPHTAHVESIALFERS